MIQREIEEDFFGSPLRGEWAGRGGGRRGWSHNPPPPPPVTQANEGR